MIYAINDSKFNIRNAYFNLNVAQDGSVLYSLYNANERSLKIYNSTFLENYSESNLMQAISTQIYIYNCTFEDNYSLLGNHGITMITSTTEIYETLIQFNKETRNKRN